MKNPFSYNPWMLTIVALQLISIGSTYVVGVNIVSAILGLPYLLWLLSPVSHDSAIFYSACIFLTAVYAGAVFVRHPLITVSALFLFFASLLIGVYVAVTTGGHIL